MIFLRKFASDQTGLRYNIASAATLFKLWEIILLSLWCSYTIKKGDVFLERNHAYGNSYRLVLVALMIALTIIVNRVFPATPVYHLTVDFVPVFIIAVLFGPFW